VSEASTIWVVASLVCGVVRGHHTGRGSAFAFRRGLRVAPFVQPACRRRKGEVESPSLKLREEPTSWAY
jgi:hypothetical protein